MHGDIFYVQITNINQNCVVTLVNLFTLSVIHSFECNGCIAKFSFIFPSADNYDDGGGGGAGADDDGVFMLMKISLPFLFMYQHLRLQL